MSRPVIRRDAPFELSLLKRLNAFQGPVTLLRRRTKDVARRLERKDFASQAGDDSWQITDLGRVALQEHR